MLITLSHYILGLPCQVPRSQKTLAYCSWIPKEIPGGPAVKDMGLLGLPCPPLAADQRSVLPPPRLAASSGLNFLPGLCGLAETLRGVSSRCTVQRPIRGAQAALRLSWLVQTPPESILGQGPLPSPRMALYSFTKATGTKDPRLGWVASGTETDFLTL